MPGAVLKQKWARGFTGPRVNGSRPLALRMALARSNRSATVILALPNWMRPKPIPLAVPPTDHDYATAGAAP